MSSGGFVSNFDVEEGNDEDHRHNPSENPNRSYEPQRNTMIVKAQITIRGSKAAIWSAIIDIERGAEMIRGIESIEVLEKPASGLVGMRWRETRILFGKPATVEKRITDAVENQTYTTKAESDGFVFVTTKKISESGDGIILAEVHDSIPQSIATKWMSILMGLLFKGVAKKAVMQDLNDIKAAVEKKASLSGSKKET
jgi:hypothetical protein